MNDFDAYREPPYFLPLSLILGLVLLVAVIVRQ